MGPRRAFGSGVIVKNKLIIFGGKCDGKFFNDIHTMELDPSDYPPLIEAAFNNPLEPMSKILNDALLAKPEKKKKKGKKIEEIDGKPEENPIEAPIQQPEIALKGDEDLLNKSAYELLARIIDDNKEFYPDIKFKIGESKIFAHKAILYNCSSIWRKKFEGETSRPSEPKKKKKNDKGKEPARKGDRDEEVIDEEEYSMWAGDSHVETVRLPDY